VCELSVRIADSLNKNDHASELDVLSSVFRIFEILFSRHYTENPKGASYKKNARFMQTLSQYLAQHYAEPITAKDAAKAHFISASRFSHLIRQNFGVSFSNYLCRQRIVYAIKNYASSELSVKDIATAVGFNDYCYFSRSFKKYVGQSPAFYFKKWKK
jgi:YesN/AraC family two-component response regulator